MNTIPMTQKSFDKKMSELKELEDKVPEATQKIADARAEGDLKENAEYHAARDELAMLNARISDIKTELNQAQIVDPSKLPDGVVVFGCTVVVEDVDMGDEETYILTGPGDEDYDEGRILATSPIGQGLVGSKVGDIVSIEVPAGEMRFKIKEIRKGDV
ncbi:Transcription elongation factor GreA [Planctomycetales bacterium 10988]|nr:Transcription elongation factor GreA [Planctomycetales bacterium 10988]